jgi:hypothetical protein
MDDHPLLTMVKMMVAMMMMMTPLVSSLTRLIITTCAPLFLSICIPLRGIIRQRNVQTVENGLEICLGDVREPG